jgi:uncharacterized hydantoinase/oxoprolinase family protein
MEVAAELFATMQDAYLCLGLLSEQPHDCDTADGRPATRHHAQARLARMLCGDVDSIPAEVTMELAARAAHTQQHALGRAVERVLQNKPLLQRVVLSGSGEAIARLVAPASAPFVNVTSLADLLGPGLSAAACAYAVAMLAAREGDGA